MGGCWCHRAPPPPGATWLRPPRRGRDQRRGGEAVSQGTKGSDALCAASDLELARKVRTERPPSSPHSWFVSPRVGAATETRCWVKMSFNQVCDDRFLKTSGCLMKFIFSLLSLSCTQRGWGWRGAEKETEREREGGSSNP